MCVERASFRESRQFEEADRILGRLLDEGVRVTDERDGSWRWTRRAPQGPDILQLAKDARRAAVDEPSDDVAREIVATFARRAVASLRSPGFDSRRDLPGRRGADAAFAFATAGADDGELYELLSAAVARETRASDASSKAGVRRAARHATEKLAAAGVDYFDERAMLWRFRYSRSKEARPKTRPPPPPVNARFADDAAPLCVDLGCGLGASALGLALAVPEINVLGVDTLAGCVRPARAAATRLGVAPRCAFVRSSALDAVKWAAREYPGPTVLVLLQFPTPFSLGDRNRTVRGDDFVLDLDLVEATADALSPARGQFYFASNVEDVALAARDTIEATHQLRVRRRHHGLLVGGEGGAARHRPTSVRRRNRVPLRESKWAGDPANARAVGPEWLAASPLPALARTETEVAFLTAGQPIFRLVFDANNVPIQRVDGIPMHDVRSGGI
ncbi:hypothetical protein CTAYLR_008661 [Chrysophaeum taylorii]|uniref:tRNA (guanine(46)-N(7))-methyltransferase n=1 Tax=Chrysophaeum taylorii TaxID=2483200 RepID=A0AAD7U5V3_9STRA|nr:hypothetical protein CTAYLR_008661 [Chrysophaeum taylorii]